MLSPEQAAKLREKLFGPGFGMPTMGAGMPAPAAPPPAAPPPAPGLGGMTGALLKAGETIEAKKDADEVAAAAAAAKGTFALPGPSISNGANTGPTVGQPGASMADLTGGTARTAPAATTGVPSLVDVVPGAKPPPPPPAAAMAPGGKPTLGGLTDKMIANPMFAKVMAKLDAKGYGGAPGMGGGAPKGPAPDLRHRMYTPGEIAQQDATLGYLKKSGELDEQAADLAAHGELQKAVLERNAAEEAEQMAAERDAKEKERLDYVQGQISLHDQQAEELAQKKVDPDHFWKSKGDGAKVGAMIAMFFGGFGSGEQSAMILKNIQGKIDADVDAQKTNIQQGWKGLAEKKGIFAERLAAFGDERMAEASSKAEYWQGISLTASAHAAETASELEKVNAQKLAEAAQFKADSFKNEIQIGAEKKWQLLEQQKAAAAAAAAAELKKQNLADREAMKQIAIEDIKANGGKYAVDASGAPGIIRDGVFVPAEGTTTAKKGGAGLVVSGVNAKGEPIYEKAPGISDLGEANKTYTSLKSKVQRLMELREKHGGGAIWSPDDQAEADSLTTQMKTELGKFYGLGALAKEDLALLNGIVPEDALATKVVGIAGSDPIGKKLSTLDAELDAKYNAAKANAGAPTKKPLSLGKPQ